VISPRVRALAGRTALAGTLLIAAAVVVAWYPTRESEARSLPTAQASTDDPENVGRLLSAVRGASPLFCELATRLVDGRVWWSNSGTSLIEVDSASAELIRWVHRKHTDARVVPRLAAGLRDEDPCVRRVAGSVLGHIDVPAAFATLTEALGHANEATRAAAAIGLGLSDQDEAVQALIRLLRDASADVRRSAAWALGAIENRAAMIPLIELLEREPNPRVREAAAWAIGEVTGS
jgi:hypothetical protein